MSEEPTTKQIKKLYAVVRRSGREPKEYVNRIKEERGINRLSEISKREISGLIDEFEGESEKEEKKIDVAENKNEKKIEEFESENEGKRDVGEEKKGKKEVVEEFGVRLNEIDALFSICVVKASKLVSKLPVSEHAKASMTLEIAKLYFFEVRRETKRG